MKRISDELEAVLAEIDGDAGPGDRLRPPVPTPRGERKVWNPLPIENRRLRTVRPPPAPQTGGPSPLAADMIKKAIVGTEVEQLSAERAIFSEAKELWQSLKEAKGVFTKAGASAAEKAGAKAAAKEAASLLLKQGARRFGSTFFGPWGTAITLGALAAELPMVQDGFMYVRDRTPGMKLHEGPKLPKKLGPPGTPAQVAERQGFELEED